MIVLSWIDMGTMTRLFLTIICLQMWYIFMVYVLLLLQLEVPLSIFTKTSSQKGITWGIENFTIWTNEKFERGDFDLSLWLIASTKVLILDKFDYSLHFFHVDTIAFFNKRIHDKWVMTLIVIVIRLQGEVEIHFEFIVMDWDSLENVQMVCIQTC